MAKRANYKGDKRRKETDRLKKQEEKRQRRFGKLNAPAGEGEGVEEGTEETGAEGTAEVAATEAT